MSLHLRRSHPQKGDVISHVTPMSQQATRRRYHRYRRNRRRNAHRESSRSLDRAHPHVAHLRPRPHDLLERSMEGQEMPRGHETNGVQERRIRRRSFLLHVVSYCMYLDRSLVPTFLFRCLYFPFYLCGGSECYPAVFSFILYKYDPSEYARWSSFYLLLLPIYTRYCSVNNQERSEFLESFLLA